MIDGKLIDSNVLVYAFDTDEVEKHSVAKKILHKIFINELNVCLSTQNLSEFYDVVTNKIVKPISSNNAKETIEDIISLSNIKIFSIQIQTIIKAIEITENYKIRYWDSLIVAVMQENNINTIITENEKDFKKIPWIKIINPFHKK